MNYPHIPGGDYYDCRDSETLEYETPAEAVAGFMDGFGVAGESISDTLKRIGNITVSVYRREEVSPGVASFFSSRLQDCLGDLFDESGYANPEDSSVDDDALEAAMPHLEAAVRAFIDKQHVWACKRIAEVKLTSEQAEALLRAEMPEVFE